MIVLVLTGHSRRRTKRFPGNLLACPFHTMRNTACDQMGRKAWHAENSQSGTSHTGTKLWWVHCECWRQWLMSMTSRVTMNQTETWTPQYHNSFHCTIRINDVKFVVQQLWAWWDSTFLHRYTVYSAGKRVKYPEMNNEKNTIPSKRVLFTTLIHFHFRD